jgi:hypothetical protein
MRQLMGEVVPQSAIFFLVHAKSGLRHFLEQFLHAYTDDPDSEKLTS